MFFYDWEQRKLGEVTEKIGSGKTPKGGNSNYQSHGVALIRSQNIFDDRVNNNDIAYISDKVDNDMKNSRVFKNDVLLNITGASIGRSAVYQSSDTANVNQHVCIIRPKDNIVSNFIQLNISSTKGQKEIELNQAGGGREGLNFQQIAKMIFSYPSYDEQQVIGLFFEKINDTITLHQRKLDKLKQLKQGYLQQLFPKPGETVPKIRFANFEGEWEERKLKQLGEIQTGNTPSTKDSSNYAKNGILWVTPTDIDSLIISDTAKKLSEKGQTKARIAKAGSILVTSIASIGKNALAKTDMGFNQQINSLTPSSENDSYFLLTQSEKWSEMMQRNAAAGTMQIVNKSEFSNIVTEVPKLDEQGQIGNFFAKLDQTITLQLSKINKLKSIKQALLQKMFI
ncbi:restriction endonuclease subunit S [Lactococcus petauri]|uniref:restriction endonuclease subunit S n=1 Tax=Lactococcus petauri TaxID=1940789 RepID=UPI003132CBC2